MTRHILGLFHGVPGARAFRRHLATEAVKPGAGVAVLARRACASSWMRDGGAHRRRVTPRRCVRAASLEEHAWCWACRVGELLLLAA